MLRYLSLSLFLLLPVIRGAAQAPVLKHYTVSDGLPSNTIYNAFQDSRGFIWFCTDLGVSRFDGHSFENFTSKNGLPDNEVFAMKEDDQRRLWLITYNKKPAYILDGTVYTAANDILCKRIEDYGIQYWDIIDFGPGQLALLGQKMFILEKNRLRPYKEALINGSRFYYFRNHGREYFQTITRMGMLENDSVKTLLDGRIQFSGTFFCKGHLYAYINNVARRMFYDIVFPGDSIKITRIDVPSRVLRFVEGPGNRIWCCTNAGVLLYDPATQTRKALPIAELSHTPVNNIFADDQQRTWYLTASDGVYMQAPAAPQLFDRRAGLHQNNILALAVVRPGLWIAGYSDGTIDVVKDTAITHIALPGKSGWNKIRYLLPLDTVAAVVGSDEGAYRVNLVNKKTDFICPFAQKSGSVNKDYCLLSYAGGAGLYEIKSGRFRQYCYQTTTATALAGAQCFWLGGPWGLYTVQQGGMKAFTLDNALSHCRITSLATWKQDGLVIATNTIGIYILKGKKWIHIDESKGLASNICRKVVADSMGNIWLLTARGVDKLSIRDDWQYDLYHFSNADGLNADMINDIALDRHKAYLATSGGLLVLDQDPRSNNVPAGVYILSAADKNGVHHFPRSLSLRYDESNALVSYTGISFADGNDITYKYLLLGGNTDTVYTQETSVNISAARPGGYQLLVWAAGKNKIWSKAPAVLHIRVRPPFWQEPWFMVCIIMLLLLIISQVIRKRVSHVRKAEREKTDRRRKIMEVEMQALRAQINPHFMFNALNAIQHYYSQNDERSANYYLSSFARLIRQTLSHAREHWIAVGEEMAMLKTYIELEQMRFKGVFDFELKTDADIASLKIPAMLLQVYTENAINHGLRYLQGRKGKLLISCCREADQLICRVYDNGIGFAAAAQLGSRPGKHQSMGLKLTGERIAMINELYHTHIVLKIDHTLSEGTLIEIHIPIQHQYA